MPEAIYHRPRLYPKQLAAIFCAARYGLIEASTKAGKTAGCMAWLLEQAIRGKAGQNFWWVAPIRDQSKIVFKRLKRAIPRQAFTAHENDLTITLAHGAVITFKGADKPDSLYGDDVYAAVIDEATRVKEGAWHAVRSTLTATKGPIRIIGNVKGRRNWAYTLARQAEGGAPGMHYAKLTAYDAVEAGILSLQEIEDAKRTLPEHVFRELYLAEPSDDGGNPFGLAAILACVRKEGLSTDLPIAYGIDLAKSVDYTVVIGLDALGRVCRFHRWHETWEQTIDRIVSLVGRVPALVDSTGVGDPVLEALQKRGGPYGRFNGFKFTGPSKQQLMEGLALAIQQQTVKYPDNEIRRELDTFEYEVTRTHVRYTAPEGLHDDCVCSLALAVEHLRHHERMKPMGERRFMQVDL